MPFSSLYETKFLNTAITIHFFHLSKPQKKDWEKKLLLLLCWWMELWKTHQNLQIKPRFIWDGMVQTKTGKAYKGTTLFRQSYKSSKLEWYRYRIDIEWMLCWPSKLKEKSNFVKLKILPGQDAFSSLCYQLHQFYRNEIMYIFSWWFCFESLFI